MSTSLLWMWTCISSPSSKRSLSMQNQKSPIGSLDPSWAGEGKGSQGWGILVRGKKYHKSYSADATKASRDIAIDIERLVGTCTFWPSGAIGCASRGHCGEICEDRSHGAGIPRQGLCCYANRPRTNKFTIMYTNATKALDWKKKVFEFWRQP